jgi:mRNA-capping enzyme
LTLLSINANLIYFTRLIKKKIGELYVGQLSSPFAQIKVSKAVRDLDGKIIECRLNEKQEWELMRERTDKSYPNAFATANGNLTAVLSDYCIKANELLLAAVINSIRNPVTTEMLLHFIEENCPRPPQQQQKRPSSTEHKLMPPPKIPKF